ncbi:MAG TPA: hypothetical protein VF719_00840, partial [Abditibacteriaceae bacterium]
MHAPASPGDSLNQWSQYHIKFLALLPAYIALAVAVGSGVYALVKTIGFPDFTWKIWLALILGLLFSFGSRCGGRGVQQFCGWFMVLLIMAVPPLSVFIQTASFIPEEVLGDGNALVTVLMGWVVVASVFAVGARYGNRPISFTSPLVPTLSLFGLLNIISVNTVVSLCFLFFVAASLYLVAYERLLNRILPAYEKSCSDAATAPHGKPGVFSSLDEACIQGKPAFWQRRQMHMALEPVQMRHTAGQYLLACAAWFAIFIGGAAVLFVPFRAMLP